MAGTTAPRATASRTRWSTRRIVGTLAVLALAVLLLLAPQLSISTGGVLPDVVNHPGTMQMLAIILIIGALAVSYDLMMGYTGLFSFGHALFFALGSYSFAMVLALTDAGFWTAVLVALGVSVVSSVLVNAVALRASLIAFSMVTLAMSQLFATITGRNYFGTGGDEGVSIPPAKMPESFAGIFNTSNLYLMAVWLLIVVFAVAKLLTLTRLGRVWQAIRENELRVAVMGYNVYLYKLSVAAISGTLAGICGIVYAIVLGGADPTVTGLFYSLGLIVMVTLGGKGRIWGALIGGVLYTYLQQRLPVLAGSDSVQSLPKALRIPLSEPQLLLGVVFLLFIFFLPGGLAQLITRMFGKRRRIPADESVSGREQELQPGHPDAPEIVAAPTL
jgi:branched-chain amino acid transport system permease protein